MNAEQHPLNRALTLCYIHWGIRIRAQPSRNGTHKSIPKPLLCNRHHNNNIPTASHNNCFCTQIFRSRFGFPCTTCMLMLSHTRRLVPFYRATLPQPPARVDTLRYRGRWRANDCGGGESCKACTRADIETMCLWAVNACATRAALWCGFAASEPPTRAVTNVASGGNWCIFGQSCVKRFVFWLLLCTRIDWVARVRFVCVCARGDDKG